MKARLTTPVTATTSARATKKALAQPATAALKPTMKNASLKKLACINIVRKNPAPARFGTEQITAAIMVQDTIFMAKPVLLLMARLIGKITVHATLGHQHLAMDSNLLLTVKLLVVLIQLHKNANAVEQNSINNAKIPAHINIVQKNPAPARFGTEQITAAIMVQDTIFMAKPVLLLMARLIGKITVHATFGHQHHVEVSNLLLIVREK